MRLVSPFHDIIMYCVRENNRQENVIPSFPFHMMQSDWPGCPKIQCTAVQHFRTVENTEGSNFMWASFFLSPFFFWFWFLWSFSHSSCQTHFTCEEAGAVSTGLWKSNLIVGWHWLLLYALYRIQPAVNKQPVTVLPMCTFAEGRTGVPYVDANMRELFSTGFMSNRGRQVSVCEHTYTHTYTHTHMCMHADTHRHMYTHMCTHTHTHTLTHSHKCAYTHTHTHTHTNMHAHTHTHTHIHTHTHTLPPCCCQPSHDILINNLTSKALPTSLLVCFNASAAAARGNCIFSSM